MSWHVELICSSVELTEQCALELEALIGEEDSNYYGTHYTFEHDGKRYLHFDENHDEHIDAHLWDDSVKDVLLRHKVNGEIRFAQLEQGASMWEHVYRDGVHTVVSVNLADIEM